MEVKVKGSVCHFCFALVPAADFEQGRASVVLKRVYCGKCTQKALLEQQFAPAAAAGRSREQEIARPS